MEDCFGKTNSRVYLSFPLFLLSMTPADMHGDKNKGNKNLALMTVTERCRDGISLHSDQIWEEVNQRLKSSAD